MNRVANRKNGTTPSHDQPKPRRAGRREDGAGRIRELGQDVSRDRVALRHVLEADRVAVALQPDVLAFVAVEVLHPQLGGIGVRGEGADRLDVQATEATRLRDGHVDLGVAVRLVTMGQGVVGPANGDRRGALVDGARLGDRRDEVAGFLKLGEEVEAGLGVVQRAAVAEGRGVDRLDRLVGDARVAGQGDLVLVRRVEEVGPVGWWRGHDGMVRFERQDAVVVAVPEAVRILGGVRDAAPRGDLVGGDEAVLLGLRAERQADIDDVRRLRALVGLVGLDGLDLVAGAGVRVELVDRDAVLRGEAGDHRPVVAPVVGQGDGGEAALLLGGRHERRHRVRRWGSSCR